MTGRTVVLVGLLALVGCGDDGQPGARLAAATGGDVARGRLAIERYGCGACHVIPGIPYGRGLVGPPLTDFAHRAYVGGQVANTPQNLMRWIRFPDSLAPGTAMPTLGVTEQEARDIAFYLYAETATRQLGPPSAFPASLLRSD